MNTHIMNAYIQERKIARAFPHVAAVARPGRSQDLGAPKVLENSQVPGNSELKGIPHFYRMWPSKQVGKPGHRHVGLYEYIYIYI